MDQKKKEERRTGPEDFYFLSTSSLLCEISVSLESLNSPLQMFQSQLDREAAPSDQISTS